MKVLLLSQHFWPESFRINEVAQSLVEQGCEVTVLTGKPNYPDGDIFPGYQVAGVQRERHEGYEIVRVPLMPRGRGRAPAGAELPVLPGGGFGAGAVGPAGAAL